MSGESEASGPNGNDVSVFQPISPPVLKSVDPMKVSQFLKERERYEIEITEKMKEVSSLSKESCKVCVDTGLLRRMHFLGKSKTISPGKSFAQLTSSYVERWVSSLVEREESTFDPSVIEEALSSLRMLMFIADPEARMLQFCNDFFCRLDSVGYDNFKDVNPKKTVKLLKEKLYPKKFQTVMQKTFDYHELIQKDVVGYVELLCEEAKAFEKYKSSDTERGSKATSKAKGKYNGGTGGKDRAGSSHSKANYGKGGTSKRRNNVGKSAAGKSSDTRPLYLNAECAKKGSRHYILTECNAGSAEEAKRLLKAYKDKKQKDESKKVYDVDRDATTKSTMVKGMFANLVTCVLCADGGSHLILLPQRMLKELQAKGAALPVKPFITPRKYGLGAKEDRDRNSICIISDRDVVLNVDLFVRHGCYLELPNVTWYVLDLRSPLPRYSHYQHLHIVRCVPRVILCQLSSWYRCHGTLYPASGLRVFSVSSVHVSFYTVYHSMTSYAILAYLRTPAV